MVVRWVGAVILGTALLAIPALAGEGGGEAQVIFEGASAGGLNRPIDNFGGAAFRMAEILPTFGRITIQQESLAQEDRYRRGEAFLRWQPPAWGGLKWVVSGGDFRAATTTADSLFGNFFFPEVTGRGAYVEATKGDSRYSFFMGGETLPFVPGVSFRASAPQSVLGLTAQRAVRKRWKVGLRLLRVSSTAQQILDQNIGGPFWMPPERRLASATGVTAQSTYSLTGHLRVYGEASVSGSLSTAAGTAWDSKRLTVRANYVFQGVTYLPLEGYYLGDRRGPFVEARYHPWKRLELSGSASDYANNLERNPSRVDISNATSSLAASLTLPWKLTVSTQLLDNRLTIGQGAVRLAYLGNRQIAVIATRPFHNHTLRVALREMTLSAGAAPVTELMPEVEETFQLKRFSGGGAIRLQRPALGMPITPAYRMVAEVKFARFTAHADLDSGNISGSSVLATNSLRTMAFRESARLGRGWTLGAESMHYWLTSRSNVTAGAPSVLWQQWNLAVTLMKQLKWPAKP